MDYRHLLKKYLVYVLMNEGTTFLRLMPRPEEFTVEEWEELQQMDREILTFQGAPIIWDDTGK